MTKSADERHEVATDDKEGAGSYVEPSRARTEIAHIAAALYASPAFSADIPKSVDLAVQLWNEAHAR